NCLINPDETAVPTVERCLADHVYDCVVIGAGLRLPPSRLVLFEEVVNAVHRSAPQAALTFNTRAEDCGAAAAPWIRHARSATGRVTGRLLTLLTVVPSNDQSRGHFGALSDAGQLEKPAAENENGRFRLSKPKSPVVMFLDFMRRVPNCCCWRALGL